MPEQPYQIQSGKWLVFISHAGEDTWIAKRIAEKIEDCGAKVFLDETHINVGEDFEERILEALDQANELLVLLTPWALTRPYVWAEIGAAWSKRIPIIVVLHGLKPEDVNAMAKVPLLLKRRNMIHINELDTYLDQLKFRLS